MNRKEAGIDSDILRTPSRKISRIVGIFVAPISRYGELAFFAVDFSGRRAKFVFQIFPTDFIRAGMNNAAQYGNTLAYTFIFEKVIQRSSQYACQIGRTR